jgi:hypothetical protein
MNHVVTCTGCGATVAHSEKPHSLRLTLRCSEWCGEQEKRVVFERRRDVWSVLRRDFAVSPWTMSEPFGLAHSQIYKSNPKMIR